MKKTSKVPWATLAISPKRALVIDADGMTVAKLEGENAVSDAYLIAAAPELLDALVSLTDHLYDAGFLGQDFPKEWKTVQLPPLFNKAMLVIKEATR